MATSPVDALIGQTIGSYVIVARVGGGGMGVVYQARDTRLGRTVALKFLPPQWSHDDEARQRFVREAQAASATSHPNICTIHDIETAPDGQLFIVMAYYEGQTLKQRLASGPLASDEALDIATQIADGLAKAHAQNVVHRDIKPGNVMLTEDGVRIVDFGLATFADALKLTAEHSTLGTAAYMSPEQVRGLAADARSDVWAVGVILYEMLTGRLPVETQTGSLVSALHAICEEPPKPLTLTFTGGFRLDPDIQTIVGKALEKDPDQRYASADALAEDVQRYLSNQPILAHPPSTTYQLRKLIARHRFASWMSLGVLVLLIGVAVMLAVQADKVRRARDRAEQEAARATAINEFLQKTFGAADPWQRGARGVSLVDALKQAEGQVQGTFKGQPAVQADVLETIAKTYYGLGQFAESERLLRSALKLRTDSGARQTDAGADAVALVAESLRQQSKWDEAATMSREELAIRRQLHGDDDGATAGAMDNLAASLLRLGQFPEAEKLSADSLRIRKRLYGDKSEEVALSLQTIGQLALAKEDDKRQEAVTRERLGILREKRGNNSAQVALAVNDLAVARMKLGDMAGAETLFNENLAICRTLFGEDHPETASAMENLGNVMYQTGRPAETIKMLEQVLAIRKRAFGDESEAVSRTLANLATVNSISGNPAAAEPLYREAYAMMVKFLGPDNPDVSEVLLGQGRNFHRLGKLADAETYLRRSLKIRLAAFGEDSSQVARVRYLIGKVLIDTRDPKRYSEADQLLQLADTTYRKSDGVANPATQQTIQARVDLYKAWGKPEKAKELEAALTAKTP